MNMLSARAKAEAHVVRLCDDRRRALAGTGGAGASATAGDGRDGGDELVLRGWHVLKADTSSWLGEEEPGWVLVLSTAAMYAVRFDPAMECVVRCDETRMSAASNVAVYSSSPSCLVISVTRPVEPTLFNMYAESEHEDLRFTLLGPPRTTPDAESRFVAFIGQAVQAFRDVHINCLNHSQAQGQAGTAAQ